MTNQPKSQKIKNKLMGSSKIRSILTDGISEERLYTLEDRHLKKKSKYKEVFYPFFNERGNNGNLLVKCKSPADFQRNKSCMEKADQLGLGLSSSQTHKKLYKKSITKKLRVQDDLNFKDERLKTEETNMVNPNTSNPYIKSNISLNLLKKRNTICQQNNSNKNETLSQKDIKKMDPINISFPNVNISSHRNIDLGTIPLKDNVFSKNQSISDKFIQNNNTASIVQHLEKLSRQKSTDPKLQIPASQIQKIGKISSDCHRTVIKSAQDDSHEIKAENFMKMYDSLNNNNYSIVKNRLKNIIQIQTNELTNTLVYSDHRNIDFQNQDKYHQKICEQNPIDRTLKHHQKKLLDKNFPKLKICKPDMGLKKQVPFQIYDWEEPKLNQTNQSPKYTFPKDQNSKQAFLGINIPKKMKEGNFLSMSNNEGGKSDDSCDSDLKMEQSFSKKNLKKIEETYSGMKHMSDKFSMKLLNERFKGLATNFRKGYTDLSYRLGQFQKRFDDQNYFNMKATGN